MRLTELLRREHELIEQAIDVLRAVSNRATETPPPTEAAQSLVRFFREFADASHHDREERALFPALEEHGLPSSGGPVGCMLHEHDDGRKLVTRMDEAITMGFDDREGREGFREAARDYAILLGQHIFKENHVLFEMAERILPAEVLGQLGAEQRERHEEALARHAEVIAELAQTYLGASAPTGSAAESGTAAERPDKNLRHRVG